MIEPTIGRVIWYWPEDKKDQPWPCWICSVRPDGRINVAGFNNEGVPFRDSDIDLFQGEEGEQKPLHSFAEWMPYQIGQAKKHESETIQTIAVDHLE